MLMQKKFVMSKTSNMSGQDPTTLPLDADQAPLALSPNSRPASRCLCSRGDKREKKNQNKVNEENTEPLRWSEKGKEARMVKAGSPADELPAATRCPLGFPGKWDENAPTVFTTSPTSSVGCVRALGRARSKGNSVRGLMLFLAVPKP